MTAALRDITYILPRSSCNNGNQTLMPAGVSSATLFSYERLFDRQRAFFYGLPRIIDGLGGYRHNACIVHRAHGLDAVP